MSGVERVHASLFVPGLPADLAGWGRALEARGYEVADGALAGGGLPAPATLGWIENPWDSPFGQAFTFPALREGDQRAVDASPGALVLGLRFDLQRERAAVAALARALADSGAVAVRLEASQASFPIARWVELVGGSDPWSLYQAVVVLVAGREGARTHGMQAFSLPDAVVAFDAETNETVASALLGTLNVVQLAEDPLLRSGHTFSPDPATPRRALERWPDASHAPGHPCHNPFGVWRLGRAGAPARVPAAQVELAFRPALGALLAEAERRWGRGLDRDQVEELAERAACQEVSPAEARDLERARGFADLDPAWVWEQWQIARRWYGAAEPPSVRALPPRR